MNTCPNNFVWEKEKTGIIVVASGLYEITFGFFSRLKPEVQLLVNGEVVIGSVMAKEKKYVHTSSNVTGLTCIDFLVLTPRSKLSLTYKGEKGGEGFLGLRKL